jgi:hypothetical protein
MANHDRTALTTSLADEKLPTRPEATLPAGYIAPPIALAAALVIDLSS